MKPGWECKRLGEMCEKISRGISPIYVEKNGVVVLNQKCIRDHKLNFEPARRHDDTSKPVGSDKFIRIGDVLVNSTGEGTLGRVAQVKNLPFDRITVDSHVSIVRPLKDKFYLDFFGYALIYIENEIEKSGAGASGQTELARSVLENQFNLTYPIHLLEQKRIVSILDQAFAAIDKAKANAEKNLKNAREVFESYLQGVFENKGDDWKEKTLGEVCEFRNGQAHEQHIDEKGKYILVNSKFISSDGEKGKRTNNALSPLFIGDIVFVMSDVPNGKALAKCFLIDKNDTYTLNQRIGAICSKVFDNDFLVYQFNRHKYLLSFNNGENQTNLRKNDILNCPLYIPQLAEQKTIVKKLDDLSSETKKLEVIYQNKITDLEELKKSILQKPFPEN
ncbi:MAG: restriction endonuclease subunit S [Bacteroidetes bacterium]|nr:restriction endonuclease subunit S [Bacteroidota bacterium]